MRLEYFTKNLEFPFFLHFGKHDESVGMHYHQDFSELVIVLEGSATHKVDNDVFQISKGDVFVINQGTSHGYENPVNFKICNIMYDFDYMFSDASDIKESSGFHALFVVEPYFRNQEFRSRTRLSDDSLESVKLVLKQMLDEYRQKHVGYISLLKAEFMKLAIDFSRKYDVYETVQDLNVFGLACVAASMEKNYGKVFSVSYMAELAGMSVRHFTRMFTVTYGIPPTKYLENIRMNKAKLLLRSSSKTVTEIAYECGFSDNNYFTRRFKALFQVTPSGFRSI
ncbi:MAG: helix-turn-helix domain-containing protein [Lachnospiraceae bacterium]|nr:helix-turn-helix domain-containing protein [Lachnospiraceae bacterium]